MFQDFYLCFHEAEGAKESKPGSAATEDQSEFLLCCAVQSTVTEAHVRRALDLFTVSTMDAVKSGVTEAVVSPCLQTHLRASHVVACLQPLGD